MSSYASSPILRGLVLGLQVMGCLVYTWPASARARPSPALCAWAVLVQLSLLAWLFIEIYIEVNHHHFLCIGEVAHVLAVVFDLAALALLPAFLTVRSRLISRVLAGLGDIPYPHGPTYMCRASQLMHILMVLVAFSFITWTYVVSESALATVWKPVFALLNIFVIARVFFTVMLFRLLFHSLAEEIRDETRQLADRHDLSCLEPSDHDHDDHGGCQRSHDQLGNCNGNREGVKCPPEEGVERNTPGNTWKDTQRLDEGHSPAGADGDEVVAALNRLERKIYVVDGLLQGASTVFCEPMIVFFVCFTVSAITGTFFIYLEGHKAKNIAIYVVLCYIYIIRICYIGHVFTHKILDAIQFLRRVSSRCEDERVKASVLSSMATYLVILLQVGGMRIDFTHNHKVHNVAAAPSRPGV
ncbi:uncharacterized protein LOC135115254 isoform X1 [Scylla paramamosain]|uniref:uncharacterized protein LOC135115254 isoform X1 n=1 Tax=Scylla paramamosain TaxID=85552 RepID=UPI003082FB38